MEASNSRVLALNILNEPGILASGIHVPKLKSCPKCCKEILSDPPQSITILSYNHVFHRACIEKDFLYSAPGVSRCPIPSCHRDIENKSADTIEDLESNEWTSDMPDIAEFLDNSTCENDSEPVSETHNSELVTKTHNLHVTTWIKEKLDAKNNDDHEFMKTLGLLEEPLEVEQVQSTIQSSTDNGNIKATKQVISAKLALNEEQEHNSLNMESQAVSPIETLHHSNTIVFSDLPHFRRPAIRWK
ncbi:11462_t:CDS:2 [Diversispora eburnea]|uniref:11462_t:CDS:1 n=1 Tax=Diversispora eburnea TaxID=1213867 RepID=A0A9N9BCK0_9GLOM|nr:11462_t:CDS:2 [Diversispora eburnea]